MEECFFKDVLSCEKGPDKLTTAGKLRIETIINTCSKTYEDGIDTVLEMKLEHNPSLTIQCHRDCVSTYTLRQQIETSKAKG